MTRRELFSLVVGLCLPPVGATPTRSRYRLDWCDRVPALGKDHRVVLRQSYQLSEVAAGAGAPMSLIDELLTGPPGYHLDTRHVTLEEGGRRARVDEIWVETPTVFRGDARG